MLSGQDVSIKHGQDVVLSFTVPGAAGATAAQWYLAAGATTPAANRDLDRATGGQGIVLADSGADLTVAVTLTAAQTELMPVGRRYHELWITDVAGKSIPVADGTFTVKDSLKA